MENSGKDLWLTRTRTCPPARATWAIPGGVPSHRSPNSKSPAATGIRLEGLTPMNIGDFDEVALQILQIDAEVNPPVGAEAAGPADGRGIDGADATTVGATPGWGDAAKARWPSSAAIAQPLEASGTEPRPRRHTNRLVGRW